MAESHMAISLLRSIPLVHKRAQIFCPADAFEISPKHHTFCADLNAFSFQISMEFVHKMDTI